MPIIVENLQDSIVIDTAMIEQRAQRMLDSLGYSNLLVGIRLTDDEELQQLNRDFRDKDHPTDILSFPFYPELKPGEHLELGPDDEPELGDIAISVARAKNDAKELGISFEDHIVRLLAHGIAHLLGHDHETDEEYEKMLELEKQLTG